MFRLKGVKYQHHQVVVGQKLLARDYPTKLSLALGLKVRSHLTPKYNFNLSLAQDLKGKEEARMAKIADDINDVLSGHTLSEDSAHELTAPMHEISSKRSSQPSKKTIFDCISPFYGVI